jgi:hypothetical protein
MGVHQLRTQLAEARAEIEKLRAINAEDQDIWDLTAKAGVRIGAESMRERAAKVAETEEHRALPLDQEAGHG